MSSLSTLPYLGSGLGHRGELDEPIRSAAGKIDWVEVISEEYLFADDGRRERLERLRELFPIVPHGAELSIGSPGEPDPLYLDALARLVDELDAPWFSDHLGYRCAEPSGPGALMPLPRSREVARELAAKARTVQAAVGAPFLLENIAYQVDLPAPMSEADFVAEVLEHCEAGLLLDLAALDANAAGHGYDPLAYLDRVPLERLVEVHLSGGAGRDGRAEDARSRPVPERVWALLDEVVARCPVPAVLIERDRDFPEDFTDLLDEVERARQAHVRRRDELMWV
ncbi:hypothetical protein HNP84_008880 [Thermocatellispora tengchongensis]|uniref:DUF692 domain-containing protein n=1 Tax=Thermocatellispora tengchongensis TaxID=1073253 RepID=A0A840PPW0_9ACTN|nr:DUF692 family multinuclear iron-containing protein [Thermocatellispora tengchongensis]MBB5139117.1 hypothetical protein [Thermocatellispora tengchongensis]